LEESITADTPYFGSFVFSSSVPSSMIMIIGILKYNSLIFVIQSKSFLVRITAETDGKSVSFKFINSRLVLIGNIFFGRIYHC
jgi:hypothetical protein